jgi:hypothetical protein
MTCRLSSVIALALALSSASVAEAQSGSDVRLVGNVGLGRPMVPLDSRARGMGNTGVTAHGVNLSMVNPAAVVSILVPGVWIAFQPEHRTVDGLVAQGEINTADFTLARIVIPFERRYAIAVGFGSFLNQNWTVQFVDTAQLSTGPVAFQETRSSAGGISQFRIDFAGMLSPKWTLGVAGIYYFGKSVLEVERVFQSDAGFSPYKAADGIEYNGLGVAVGAEWKPLPEMIVGLSGTLGSDLDLESDSTGAAKSFSLPLAIDFGASWELAPDFFLALAVGWTRWSALSDELPRPGASDYWRFGLGSEVKLLGSENTRVIGRIGAHLEQLPFRLRRGAPWERAMSFGLGSWFRQGLGRFDIAYEFGKRGQKETNEIQEDFSRWTFTLAVFTR